MMRLQRPSTYAGLLAGSLLALSATPAEAFSFTTNFTGSDAKGDILLNSVELDDGSFFDRFSLVTGATIISNDLWTGGNTGAASADLGDDATIGLSQERVEDAGVVAAVGNLNLNSIIDTEETGSFVIDVAFGSPVDNLFFWERGMNSKLDVQALDGAGNAIGNLLNLYSRDWDYAGYSINTQEIGGAQRVGSLGVSLADLGVASPVSSIRLTSRGSAYNGPDWKVVGSATVAVPEPATVLGLGAVASLLLASRRKQNREA